MVATEPRARASRPRLTARSVVASTLLGVHPPELPTRSLVATAELLGVSAGSARTAISRMVAAGELDPVDDGYRLASPTLLARQTRQDLSRTVLDQPWDGTWRTLVVAADARPAAERIELRAALGALRFAELREGVWLRPDNLPAGVLPDAEATAADQCRSFTSRPDDDPAALAADLLAARRLGGGAPPTCWPNCTPWAPGSTTATPTRWPRVSSPLPPCSATSRPTPCSPPTCCRATGRAATSAPNTPRSTTASRPPSPPTTEPPTDRHPPGRLERREFSRQRGHPPSC